MASPESKLWQELEKPLRKKFRADRVEDRNEFKFPDVILLHRDTAMVSWVELKATGIRKDGTFKIPWRKGQAGWLAAWAQDGGTAWLLVHVRGQGYYVFHAKANAQWVQDIKLPICPGDVLGLGGLLCPTIDGVVYVLDLATSKQGSMVR